MLKIVWRIGTLISFAFAGVVRADDLPKLPQLAASEKEAGQKLNDLKKQLFPDPKSLPGCLALDKNTQKLTDEALPSFTAFLRSIMDDLKQGRSAALQHKFHERIRKKGMGERILNAMQYKYKKPWDVSVYKTWALATAEGDRALIDCATEGIALTTRHSYPLQFGVWIEVMGQNELGRVYVSIVPSKNDWYIGGWMNQQWTQSGKDYVAWYERGQKFEKSGQKREAFMAFDMAYKLLQGDEFMEFPDKAKIAAQRDQVGSTKTWPEELNKLQRKTSIVYASTMFAEDGVGLLVREQIDETLSTADLRKRCFAQGKQLITAGWLTPNTAGLYCSFVTKAEPIDKEGVLGGMYFTQKQIREAEL